MGAPSFVAKKGSNQEEQKAQIQAQNILCKFGNTCRKEECKNAHPKQIKQIALQRSEFQRQFAGMTKAQKTAAMAKIPCKYDPDCYRPDCRFKHVVGVKNKKDSTPVHSLSNLNKARSPILPFEVAFSLGKPETERTVSNGSSGQLARSVAESVLRS